jgi:GH15 family glucan-1,4-alpha-glucosidase
MWPTITRAALYVLSRINPEVGLVYSEQDLWEETGGYLLYTNACCLAGLKAAADVARELGEKDEAAMWPPAIRDLERTIQEKFQQGGIYVGELNPYEPYGVRQDYVLDISNLGMCVPFSVLPCDDPAMVRTVELIEQACDYAIGGVGRYASDLFVGGNPWSLSALWMGMYHAAAGNEERARHYLDWCLRHAARHDFLPEQSDKRTGEPASAVPLGWSHAWAIVLLQMLGKKSGGPPRALPAENGKKKTESPGGELAAASSPPTGSPTPPVRGTPAGSRPMKNPDAPAPGETSPRPRS